MKRISEAGKLTGVSRRTLQYYDDEGVLAVERSENNYRLYDEASLGTIWKIMLYKEMGFELKQIKQLLRMSDEKQKEQLILHMETIRSEIRKLQIQTEFISLVLSHGMPRMPEESEGVTYKESIKQLRKKLILRSTGQE